MKLETVALAELISDPNNARKHDAKNLAAIAESLSQFGQRKPIVITKDKVVVAGNGTIEAAKSLNWEFIDVVQVPDDWSEDRVKAFALADNRTAELASWDMKVLEAQLGELNEVGWNLEGIGFEYTAPDELENIEEVPLPEDRPRRTSSGQLWQLGQHRLFVGDSTASASYEKLLNGDQVDLVLTDPPYNVDYHGGSNKEMSIQNDNMSDSDFGSFLKKTYDCMINVTRPGGPIYVFHADSSGHIFRNEFVNAGWELKQILIWVKNTFVMGRQDYHWQHEPILYGWKPGAGHKWYGKRNKATVIDDALDFTKLSKGELVEIVREAAEMTTVVREDKTKRNDVHPTMKPINLVARLMSNSSKPEDIVLDPFGGSGSTLIAAEQLDRRAYLIELDTQYADAILARWEFFTGNKAELLAE